MSLTLADIAAAEVRAEMARQRVTREEMAKGIDVSLATLGRRLAGDSPFDLAELERAAAFLDVPVLALLRTEVTV